MNEDSWTRRQVIILETLLRISNTTDMKLYRDIVQWLKTDEDEFHLVVKEDETTDVKTVLAEMKWQLLTLEKKIHGEA
jgi:hypothetical protein